MLNGSGNFSAACMLCAGLTMSKLVPHLEQCGPASVRVASLLEKRTSRSCGYQADYVGFRIPDEFVVGYNLGECFMRDEGAGVGSEVGWERRGGGAVTD